MSQTTNLPLPLGPILDILFPERRQACPPQSLPRNPSSSAPNLRILRNLSSKLLGFPSPPANLLTWLKHLPSHGPRYPRLYCAGVSPHRRLLSALLSPMITTQLPPFASVRPFFGVPLHQGAPLFALTKGTVQGVTLVAHLRLSVSANRIRRSFLPPLRASLHSPRLH